jgi:hypothetical protein
MLHERYKLDDNAADRAVSLAREKYPAANFAAETLVIYPLQRPGAPELPEEGATADGREVSGEIGGGGRDEALDEVSVVPQTRPEDGAGS